MKVVDFAKKLRTTVQIVEGLRLYRVNPCALCLLRTTVQIVEGLRLAPMRKPVCVSLEPLSRL